MTAVDLARSGLLSPEAARVLGELLGLLSAVEAAGWVDSGRLPAHVAAGPHPMESGDFDPGCGLNLDDSGDRSGLELLCDEAAAIAGTFDAVCLLLHKLGVKPHDVFTYVERVRRGVTWRTEGRPDMAAREERFADELYRSANLNRLGW